MFDEFNGLPAHVLLVHAAVVFVPLLAAASVVYALVPRLRARVGWVAALLAVAAPVAALFAKLSGTRFRERLVARGMAGEPLERIDDHMAFGERTFWWSLGLGAATTVLVLLTSRARRAPALPSWVNVALAGVVVVLAAVAGFYVFKAGDSGANAVWGGT